MTEDTLLSYLKSPEDYIKTTAEQYMRDNQEEFLAQFLKKDALLAEYQMLSQDSDAPVYRMRAITDALQKSGAKTVNVTVQKDGVELTFKTSAESLKAEVSVFHMVHCSVRPPAVQASFWRWLRLLRRGYHPHRLWPKHTL